MLLRVSKTADAVPGAPQFFVADGCFPQTIDVLRSRAEPLGIELVIGDLKDATFTDRMFGALVQTPDEAGRVLDLSDFIAKAKKAGVLVAVGSDLLSHLYRTLDEILAIMAAASQPAAAPVGSVSQRTDVSSTNGTPRA